MRAHNMRTYGNASTMGLMLALVMAVGLAWPQSAMAQTSTCGQSGYYPDICEPDCFETPSAGTSVSFDPAANDYNETGSPVVLDGSSLVGYPELSLQNGLITYTPSSPPGALPYQFAYQTQHGGLASAEIRLAGVTTNCDVDNPGQPPVPPAPTNFTATVTAVPSVVLTWGHANGAPALYRVFRADTVNGTYVAFPDLPGTATSFEDTNVIVTSSYHYRVQSKGHDGALSAMAGPASATINPLTSVTVRYGSITGPVVTNGYITGTPLRVPVGYQWTSCTPASNPYCEYRIFIHNPLNTALTVTQVTNPGASGVEVDNLPWNFQVTQNISQIPSSGDAEVAIQLQSLRSDENIAYAWVRMRFNNGQLPDFIFQLRVDREVGRPVIDAHPVAISVIRGTSATFSVTAHHTGSQPMAYYWSRNTTLPPSAPDGFGNGAIPMPHACFSGQRHIGQGTATLTVRTTPGCPPPTIPNNGPYNDFFVTVANACNPGEQGCNPEFGRDGQIFSRRAALEIIDLSFNALPSALTHVPNDRSVQLAATAVVAPVRPLTYTWLILDAAGQTHDCRAESTYCAQWGLSNWNTNTARVNLVDTVNASFAGTMKLRVRAEISPTLSVTTDPATQPIHLQFYAPDSLPRFADSFYRGAAFKRADRTPLHALGVQEASTPALWTATPGSALRIDQSIDALELGDMPAGMDWRQYRHAEVPFAPGNNPQLAKSSVEYFDGAVWQAQAWFRSASSTASSNLEVGDELVARIEANNGTSGTRRVILSRKRSDTSWIAYADVPFTTTNSAVPLTLEYDPYTSRANVWFNGAMVIANVPVPGARPNIQFAGFSVRARNTATTDSVAVRGYAAGRRSAQPPSLVPMFASEFDLATFGDWSAKVDPGLTPLLTQITAPTRLRVTATPNNNAWLADRSPVAAHRHLAEFELDTSSLSALNASDVPVLYTLNDLAGAVLLQVQMRGGATASLVDLRVRVNAGSGFVASNWIRDVSRTRQRLRVELASPELGSATPGNVVGTLSVTPVSTGLTRTEVVTTTGSTLQIEESRLGLVAGTRETIAGALIYDNFLAHRPRQ